MQGVSFDAAPMEFFRQLYRHTEEGSLEVRAIDCIGSGLKPKSKSQWFPIKDGRASYFGAIEYASDCQAGGYDVFFGVNPRIRNGQDDDDVLCGVALWADIDGLASFDEAKARLEEALVFPVPIDAAVFSGGGLHLYSFLKVPRDRADEDWPIYKRALRAMSRHYQGDPKCTNESRVLRFPCSYSHKRKVNTSLWLANPLR